VSRTSERTDTTELEATASETAARLVVGVYDSGTTAQSQLPPNTVYEGAIRSGFPLADRSLFFSLLGARFAAPLPNSNVPEGEFLRSCVALDTTSAPALNAYYDAIWTLATLSVRRPPKLAPPGYPAYTTHAPDVLSVTFTIAPRFTFDLGSTASISAAFAHVPPGVIAPADPTTVPFAIVVKPECLAAAIGPDGLVHGRGAAPDVRSDVVFLRAGAAHRAVRGDFSAPPIALVAGTLAYATAVSGTLLAVVLGPAAAPVFAVCTACLSLSLLSIAYGDGSITVADPPEEVGGAVPSKAVGTYTVYRLLLTDLLVVRTRLGLDDVDATLAPRADEGQNTPAGGFETTIGEVANSAFVYAAVLVALLLLLGLVLPSVIAAAFGGSDLSARVERRVRLAIALHEYRQLSHRGTHDERDSDGERSDDGGDAARTRPTSAMGVVRLSLRGDPSGSGNRPGGDSDSGESLDSDDDSTAKYDTDDHGANGHDGRRGALRRVRRAIRALRRARGVPPVPERVDALLTLVSRCTFRKAAAVLATPSRLLAPCVLLGTWTFKCVIVAVAGATEGVLADTGTAVAAGLSAAPSAVFATAIIAAVLSNRFFAAEGVRHDPYAVGYHKDKKQQSGSRHRALSEAQRRAAADSRQDAAADAMWRRWARVFFPSAVAAVETRRRAAAAGEDPNAALDTAAGAAWRRQQQVRDQIQSALDQKRKRQVDEENRRRGRGHGAEAVAVDQMADTEFSRHSRRRTVDGKGEEGDVVIAGEDGAGGAVQDSNAPDRSSWYRTVEAFHRTWLAWGAARTAWRSLVSGTVTASARTPDHAAPVSGDDPDFRVGLYAECYYGAFADARAPRRSAVAMTVLLAVIVAVIDGVSAATTTHHYFGIAVGRSTSGLSADNDPVARNLRAGGPLTASDGVESVSSADKLLWFTVALLCLHVVVLAVTRPYTSPLRNAMQGIVALLTAAAALAFALALTADSPFLNFPNAVSSPAATRYRANLVPSTPTPLTPDTDFAMRPSQLRLPPANVEIPDLPWRDAGTRVLIACLAFVFLFDIVLIPAAKIFFDVGELMADTAWHQSRVRLVEAEAALEELREQTAAVATLADDPAALDARRAAVVREVIEKSPLMKRQDARLISLNEVAATAVAAARHRSQYGGRKEENTELGMLLGGADAAVRRAKNAIAALEQFVADTLRAQGEATTAAATAVTPKEFHVPLPPESTGLRTLCVVQGIFFGHVTAVTSPHLTRLSDAVSRRDALHAAAQRDELELHAMQSPLLQLLSSTGGSTEFHDPSSGGRASYVSSRFAPRGKSPPSPYAVDLSSPPNSAYTSDVDQGRAAESGQVHYDSMRPQPRNPLLHPPAPSAAMHRSPGPSPSPRRPPSRYRAVEPPIEIDRWEAQDMLQYL
jgi:hypothetical protein